MLSALIRKSTGGVALVSLVLWLGYSIVLFQKGPYTALQDAIQQPMLEETVGYGTDEVADRLARLTPEGRQIYSRFQFFDTWGAILMAMALTFCVGFVVRRWSDPAGPLRLLLVVPLLLAGSELLENLLLLLLIGDRVPIDGPVAGIAGAVTSIKLGLAFAAVPFVVLALVGLGFRRFLHLARIRKQGDTRD